MNRLLPLIERLQDPGSLRSLVVLVFMVRGQVLDDATATLIVDGILAFIAFISFCMKPRSTAPAVPAPEAVKELVEQTASATVDQLSQRVAEQLRSQLGNSVGVLARGLNKKDLH